MVSSVTKGIASPIRWAGGKKKLSSGIVGQLPLEYNRYWEPMAGGAALFFQLRPSVATISDTNCDLINYYRILRDQTKEFLDKLLSLSASKELYYRFRSQSPVDELDRAVRFAYLNRLSWNGVYRVNAAGQFNVPIGSRLPANPWKREHLEICAAVLGEAELVCDDVLNVLEGCEDGDLVFLDPPYPKGARSGNGFNRYTPDRFGLSDHMALAEKALRLHERGVYVAIAVAGEPELVDIYPSEFNRRVFRSTSLIACTGESRCVTEEYLLHNIDAR